MTRNTLTVRTVTEADESRWKELFRGYRAFYELAPDQAVVDRVWSWIADPDHECRALVAVDTDTGTIVGIADFRRFSRPSTGSVGLWLDDLYTDPAVRGRGIGRALVRRLQEIAQEEGATTVRWITAEDNHRAQILYTQVATRTRWVTYDAAPAAPSVPPEEPATEADA
ncbi:GNAT family N-acetyltransferase [Brevibacterium litoralis]|uniref:GNAT family N-acetyltransferase n=1 Tax=Brevibacterium litoralis TaxID=3138935 RepID=UPI0032EC9B72